MSNPFAGHDPIALALLGIFAAVVLLWGLLALIEQRKNIRQRLDKITGQEKAQKTAQDLDEDLKRAVGQRSTGLEAFDAKQKSGLLPERRKQIIKALTSNGFIRPFSYYLRVVSMLTAALGLLLWFALGTAQLAFLLAFMLVIGGFYLLVKRTEKRRLAIIEREFAGAIDIMVRAVKSGMPLNQSLHLLVQEAHPYIAREFRLLLDEMNLGIPMSECMARLASRIQIPDVQFFTVVLSLQSSSGGSIADALEATANTLRSRRTLREKVIIMSNEAKASAIIIGSLPLLVMGAMLVTSPNYISLLFTTTIGNIALGFIVFWMGTGVLIMRKMINFEV